MNVWTNFVKVLFNGVTSATIGIVLQRLLGTLDDTAHSLKRIENKVDKMNLGPFQDGKTYLKEATHATTL